MILRSYDLGLGSLWIGDVFNAYEAIKEYFDKPWRLSGAIALGYPAESDARVPSRVPVSEVAEFYK